MTQYIVINAQKRNFTVFANIRELSDTPVTRIDADSTYIARNGDTYIARNGDTYVAHNYTENVYPPIIKAEKRTFMVRGKVNHG